MAVGASSVLLQLSIFRQTFQLNLELISLAQFPGIFLSLPTHRRNFKCSPHPVAVYMGAGDLDFIFSHLHREALYQLCHLLNLLIFLFNYAKLKHLYVFQRHRDWIKKKMTHKQNIPNTQFNRWRLSCMFMCG